MGPLPSSLSRGCARDVRAGVLALEVGLLLAGVGLGPCEALVELTPVLLLALLSLLVRAFEHARSHLAAAQAERESCGQRNSADERRVCDAHDAWCDLQLLEDHER